VTKAQVQARGGVVSRVALAVMLATAMSMTGCAADPATPADTPPDGAATTTTAAATDNEPFVMDIGMEYDRCGIGIAVVFIPKTATSGLDDVEPVIYGGQISQMQDTVSTLIGTDPIPDNAAKAVPGTDITILDRTFRVVSVDVGEEQVTVQAMCQ